MLENLHTAQTSNVLIYIYSQVKKGLLTKKSLTEVSNIAVMHRPLRKFTYEKK